MDSFLKKVFKVSFVLLGMAFIPAILTETSSSWNQVWEYLAVILGIAAMIVLAFGITFYYEREDAKLKSQDLE